MVSRDELILESPVTCRLPAVWREGAVGELLRAELGYEDRRVLFQLREWKQAQAQEDRAPFTHWFVRKHGRDALDAKVAELEAERFKSVLHVGEDGLWRVPAGLAPTLARKYGGTVRREFDLPAWGEPYRWAAEPPPLRAYQVESVQRLRGTFGQPAAIELATGLGKSRILLELVRLGGCSAIVVAPLLSIARQLYATFLAALGAKVVGRYYDSKKEANKPVVIAVSKSLTNLPPSSPNGVALASKRLACFDEAHLLPADTLAQVVLGLLGRVGHRYFVSGTQLRTDGLDLLLAGITGPVLQRMDLGEGVAGGWLAPPRFVQFQVPSAATQRSGTAVELTRAHLHRNPAVAAHAAGFVRLGLKRGRRPLVLLQEVSQFPPLLKHFEAAGLRVGFAHGGVDAEAAAKLKLGPAWTKMDPETEVARFVQGETDVLVGTQCIGTGTDIPPVSLIVDLVGLGSEIRLRQNVGRGTRMYPGKRDCLYADYDTPNVPVLANLAAKRRKILEAVRGPVEISNVGVGGW